MPDLSQKGVHEFWNQYHDKMIYRVVSFMEGVEDWTLDGNPQLEEGINQLSRELDDIKKIDISKLGHQQNYIDVCNAISSGRALRLLQALDSVHPGSASKLLIHAEESSNSPDDPPGLFLRRNIVFERLRLLGRVFSASRLKLVVAALEGEDHE